MVDELTIHIQVMAELENNKTLLSRQEYKTIRGQLSSGQILAAQKGINKILRRKQNEKQKNAK